MKKSLERLGRGLRAVPSPPVFWELLKGLKGATPLWRDPTLPVRQTRSFQQRAVVHGPRLGGTHRGRWRAGSGKSWAGARTLTLCHPVQRPAGPGHPALASLLGSPCWGVRRCTAGEACSAGSHPRSLRLRFQTRTQETKKII